MRYAGPNSTFCQLSSQFQPHLQPGTLLGCGVKKPNLLTYSTLQSLSWEANWFAASQEIPSTSRNPKVHYCTHKRPPPVSILGQPNPVHITTCHLLEIHRNIINPTMPRSPQWSPSLRFPQQDPIHPLSSPIRATCPAHLIQGNQTNLQKILQILVTELLLMPFSLLIYFNSTSRKQAVI